MKFNKRRGFDDSSDNEEEGADRRQGNQDDSSGDEGILGGLGSGIGFQQSSTSGIGAGLGFSEPKRKPSKPTKSSKAQPRPKVDEEFGSFEKYSKGIGLKLLKKMGYKEGQGLGADGSGINAPIDVKLRPTKMGLGHGGFDERADRAGKDSESDEEAKPAIENRWKRTGKRQRRKFKSAQQLIIEEEETPVVKTSAQPTRIVDMTGRETKILTSISETIAPTQLPERFPELCYNMTTMAQLSKQDLLHISNQLRLEKSMSKTTLKEVEEIQKAAEENAKKLDEAQKVYAILKVCKQKSLQQSWEMSKADVDLNVIKELFEPEFKSLRQLCDEYGASIIEKYDVDSFFVTLISPVFKRSLDAHWNLNENPNYSIENIMEWKALLMKHKSDGTMCAFEHMLYTIWLPKLRSFVNNEWEVTVPDKIIELLEAYARILPDWMYLNIIEQLILPKIKRCLDNWTIKDGWQIHVWIFPWLPVLGEHLLELWPSCRRVLQQTLKKWTPDDRLGLEIINKWENVFDEKEQQQLITNAILPNLVIYLRSSFTINPQNQDITPLRHVFVWKDLVSSGQYSNLFETEFFPEWSNCLWIWVTSEGAKLDEITTWYQSWKQLFQSQGLDSLPACKEGFRIGLDMMNQGISSQKPRQFVETLGKRTEAVVTTVDGGEMTFKDYIETLCAEASVTFIPTQKLHDNGMRIYRMGKNYVYMSDDILYIQRNGVYKYIEIEDAIEQSK